MKKVITILTLFLAFSYSSNAQEIQRLSAANSQNNEKSSKEIIIGNVEQLSKVVKLEEGLKNDLTNLLYMRTEAVQNSKTNEEKQAAFDKYTSKLMSAFNEDQLEMIKKNKELYNSLTQLNTK